MVINDKQLIRMVTPYTYSTPDILMSLKHLASIVNSNNVPGDIVECGVCKGGSAAFIGKTLLPNQRLWLYDSFEGLPEPSPIDGEDAKKWAGGAAANESSVLDILNKVGITSEQYIIKKGWFKDTFKEPLPDSVALLHCDADWYESTTDTLETFYPLIPDGGCIVLDDFGWWEGCREAFYDFCFKYKIKPLLERVGRTQAYWFKGKIHNRDMG